MATHRQPVRSPADELADAFDANEPYQQNGRTTGANSSSAMAGEEAVRQILRFWPVW